MSEFAFIARPLLIHLLVEAGIHPEQRAHTVVKLNIAAVGAFCADRGGGKKVPRSRLETIGAREESAHRAQLDNVSAEAAMEFSLGEGGHLHVGTPFQEVELGIAADVFGEAGAARTVNAALAVKHHIVGEGI